MVVVSKDDGECHLGQEGSLWCRRLGFVDTGNCIKVFNYLYAYIGLIDSTITEKRGRANI